MGLKLFRKLIVLFLICAAFDAFAAEVNPLDYGLLKAKNGVERYEVLYKCHQAALKEGRISYRGIGAIELEIPANAKPIPLPEHTDFAGVKISVKNNTSNVFLFSMEHELIKIDITERQFNKKRFRRVKELKRGLKLLIIEDKTPWVENRRGYSYGAQRKDILLLKNGKGQNQTIFPYTDGVSSPVFKYCDATAEQKVIKNLNIERTPNSSFVTYIINIAGCNNVMLKNISIVTPASELNGDKAITIKNSTNIVLEDVVINGTYSLSNKYGYGISMNNVWNSRFINLNANGNWGVFGTNNTNYVRIEDSDINRFDIHCYGRDIYCNNTIFRDKYNQFSSLYGTLRFEDCQFISFVPVLFESSFSAYSPFILEIENCVLDVDKDRPYLIKAGKPSVLADKPRKEFEKVSWPDISIKNLVVHFSDEVKTWDLFEISGDGDVTINDISMIVINGLTFNEESVPVEVRVSNKKVSFKNRVKVKVHDSSILQVYGLE